MRNETALPPDLQLPQDVEPTESPLTPDLAEGFPAVDPKEPQQPNEGTEFYPDDILDEDPELGGPKGVANEAREGDLMDTVAETRPSQIPGEGN